MHITGTHITYHVSRVVVIGTGEVGLGGISYAAITISVTTIIT